MSKERLKEKYAIGSKETPTLSECFESEECTRYFFDSIRTYVKMFDSTDIHDLKIDCYLHAIKNFDGRANFLSFLYFISHQKGMRLFQKKLRRQAITQMKRISKSTHLTAGYMDECESILEEYLTEDLVPIAYDKYYRKMTNEELCMKYNMTTRQMADIIYSIKRRFMV